MERLATGSDRERAAGGLERRTNVRVARAAASEQHEEPDRDDRDESHAARRAEREPLPRPILRWRCDALFWSLDAGFVSHASNGSSGG
jgi:hypothetical protein